MGSASIRTDGPKMSVFSPSDMFVRCRSSEAYYAAQTDDGPVTLSTQYGPPVIGLAAFFGERWRNASIMACGAAISRLSIGAS